MPIKQVRPETCYSWIICLSAFISSSLQFGLHASYGSLFVAITNEMKISETAAAWIGSISFSIIFMSASLTSMLCKKYGCRPIMLFGTFLYSSGLISSTFVEDPYLLFLTYSIVIGFGSSCIYFSCLLILPSYFHARLSLASGIVCSGTGIGGLMINPLMGKLLQAYGFRKTLLIYASFSLFMYMTGIIFRPNRRPGENSDAGQSHKTLIVKPRLKEPSLLCNRALILLTLCHSLICFGFYIPQVHLIRLALLKGISFSKATMLPGYIAAAQALGKILLGKIADWPRLNRLMTCQLCLLVTTVANCLAPLSLSYIPLTMYAVSWGFFDGAYNIVVIFLTGDVAGKHRLHSAYGIVSTVSSVSMLLGPPMAGFIHAYTGSYETVFFLAGGNITVAICLMFLIPWVIPDYVRQSQESKLMDPDYKARSDVQSESKIKEHHKSVWGNCQTLEIAEGLNDFESSTQISTSVVSWHHGAFLSPYMHPGNVAEIPLLSTTELSKSSPAVLSTVAHRDTTMNMDMNSGVAVLFPLERLKRFPAHIVSSIWSVSSLWNPTGEDSLGTRSRDSLSDSGIYLSTKKDSIISVCQDQVQVQLWKENGRIQSRNNHPAKSYYRVKQDAEKPTVPPFFAAVDEVITERVTCV